MKKIVVQHAYGNDDFPGALQIALNCGPKTDISSKGNNRHKVEPPAVSSKQLRYPLLFQFSFQCALQNQSVETLCFYFSRVHYVFPRISRFW